MKTIIKASQYNHEDKYERIQGVIDYLNDLRNCFFTFEELDLELPQAQEVYYCDFYCCEIDNGGLSRFFDKTDSDINNFVLNGLEHMKAFKNRELFKDALRVVEQTADNPINKALDDLTALFYDVDLSESILDLNYTYIATISDLKVVADDDYQTELATVISTIPNYSERKEKFDKFLAENKPSYQIIAEQLCDKYDLELISVNAMDYGDGIVSDEEAAANEENGVVFYHISTNQGYYYVIDTGDLATLVEGSEHYVLGSIPVKD